MKYTEPRTQPETFPSPNEGQKVMPKVIESDDIQGEKSDEAGVDIDKEKIKTYPKSTPPELY